MNIQILKNPLKGEKIFSTANTQMKAVKVWKKKVKKKKRTRKAFSKLEIWIKSDGN